MSLVMSPSRTGQQQGDPVMSRKLRLPFLGWQGKRTNKEVFAEAGIQLQHGSDWLANDLRILRDADQAKLLAHHGIMAKWRELERRGVVL